ncbi:MAG: hypothetical protein OXC65_00325 [Thiotrichales bacterium]|nr:hypothetical protein [Thiotrichales bacterium]MCY4283770.1 hypothetical protein [Thiotrichales bacterium]
MKHSTSRSSGLFARRLRSAAAGLAAVLMLAALAQPAAATETRPVSGVTAQLFAEDIQVREGEYAIFEFALSRSLDFDLRYAYRTQDGFAKAGENYQATQGHVVFPAGKRFAQVRVKTHKGRSGLRDFKLVLSDAQTHGYGMVWGQYVWTGRWVVSGLPETKTVRAWIRNVVSANQGKRQ